MNALPSSNPQWFGLGLGLLALLACSAEASAPPPSGPGTGGQASGGSGGSGGGLPLAGTSVGPTGGQTTSGGSTPGTAGTAPGTAGTMTGGGGGGALTVCPSPPAAGTIADLLIDDLEDKDNGLSKIGDRTGFWYTYADKIGTTIVPKPDDPPGAAGPLTAGTVNCHAASTGCIIITGTTAANDLTVVGMEKYGYAGVGFDFSNASKSCVYNGSAYTGIKFWARGNVAVTIKLNTTAVADVQSGGTCTTGCLDGFSPAGVDVLLSTDWTQVDLAFATAKQAGWGTAATLDKAALLGLQIQIPPGQAAFEVAIDDVTFY